MLIIYVEFTKYHLLSRSIQTMQMHFVVPVTGSVLVTKRNQEQTTLSSTTPILHYNSRIIFHVSDNASTCTC